MLDRSSHAAGPRAPPTLPYGRQGATAGAPRVLLPPRQRLPHTLGRPYPLSSGAAPQKMMPRSSLLLVLSSCWLTTTAAKQDCGVAIWWGGLINPSQDDCSGDPLVEGGSCVEALNTLLKAAPTSAVGTVTQLITGQDAASLAFKTATGRDVPTYCDDVCTQSCYSGFWFNSPCILDEGAMRCAPPLCLCA